MTWLELESEIANLENAEKLLLIYSDFLDECPTKEKLKHKNEDAIVKAFVYSERTETYKSALYSAFDQIREVKKSLSIAVGKMLSEAKAAKQ